MTNPFRQQLESIDNDGTFASRIFQSSLLAAESKFFPPRQAYLNVDILGAEVEAYLSSEVAKTISNSTAYFAKAFDDPHTTNARMSNQFHKKVGLRNVASSGNRIVFGFTQPADDPQTPLIDESRLPSLGEKSAENLALSLPSSEDDDASLDNALALLDVERNGLYKLSETLRKFRKSIRLGLSLDGAITSEGTLTAEQANVLWENLSDSKPETWQMKVTGRLDGMRSRRRQFFLECDNGTELTGTIEAELVQQMPRYIDKKVTATITAQQLKFNSGRIGKPVYRIDAIRGISESSTLI